MLIHQLLETTEPMVRDLGLYRGLVDVPTDEFSGPIKFTIRTDRRPRDSSIPVSVIFNYAFELAHGIPDVRKRAAFCTTDVDEAYGYAGPDGVVVEVMPIVGTKFAYNPHVPDSLAVSDLIEQAEFEELIQAIQRIGAVAHSMTAKSAVQKALATVEQTQRDALEKKLESLAKHPVISNYTVSTMSETTSLPSSPVEVMLFDVPHYYGEVLDDVYAEDWD